MGRVVTPYTCVLAFAAIAGLILVSPIVSSVERWRDLRRIDRIVEARHITEAVDFTLSRFNSENRDEWLAVRDLGLSVLRQGLAEHDPYERCYAATSLVSYGDWSGRSVIESSLEGKDFLLQKAAIEGLAEARDPRANRLLEQFYQSGSRFAQSWTVEALARTEDHRALPLLLTATTSSDEGSMLWGLWGLGRVNDRRVVGYLYSLEAKETNPLISAAIAHALLMLGDRSLGATELIEVALYDPNPDRASNAALELGDAHYFAAVPQLKTALYNIKLDLTVRLAAAAALTHYGNREGLGLMSTVAEDPYTGRMLAPLLLDLNFEISRSLLISAMASKNVILQLAATEAIGRLGGKEEVEVLTGALSQTSESMVTAQIGWSLGHIAQPAGIRPLLLLLKNSNPTVRYSAADGLARTATILLAKSKH